MRTDEQTAIERLLKPRSLALVGVSPQPGSPGEALLGNFDRFHYPVDIHLVSRGRTEVLGRPCYPTIDELPDGIDLALLLVPRSAVLESLHACIRRGIDAVVVYASGFAELDDEGREAQLAIAAVARGNGVALLGPNCLGYINYADGLVLNFSRRMPEPLKDGPSIAFISQSGGTPTVARFALRPKGVNVAFQITTGNEAVLGVEDFLVPMLRDPRMSAVALYAEQFRSPQRLLDAAEEARRCCKPIILLHPGISAAAQASALSHTGALVGDYALMREVVRDAGIVMVDTLEEMLDTVELLVRFETIPTRGPAIITDSGGFKSITSDFAETIGLTLPPFSAETDAKLGAVLPEFVRRENPIDVTGQAMVDTQLYQKTVDALADDNDTGVTMTAVIHIDPDAGLARIRSMLPHFVETKGRRPAVLTVLGYDAEIRPEAFSDAAAAGIPFFRSPERALRAISHVVRYGTFLQRPHRAPRVLPPALTTKRKGVVPEYEAKQLLAATGIAVPRGVLVADCEAAIRAAAILGFPVALKLQSVDLAHKSEAGALELNLRDHDEVADGWSRMHTRVHERKGEIPIDGVLVEAMGLPGVEMIAAARRDPAWGITLLAGLGGIGRRSCTIPS